MAHRPRHAYDFSRDLLGVAGLPPLIEALHHDPGFVSLNLSGTGVSDCNIPLLLEALKVGAPMQSERGNVCGRA